MKYLHERAKPCYGARLYEAAGGTALLFSWLKTISMRPDPKLEPFAANAVAAEPTCQQLGYFSIS